MTLAVWQATIVDEKGDVQGAASVEVRLEDSGSPIANIYTDREGTTPAGNPISADGDGFVRFYAPGGAYRITATKGGFSRVWRHQAIGLNAESDGIAPGVAWRASEETADADPGTGFFRLNNADVNSATEIYISTDDTNETDQSTFLESFDDAGTSAARGTLIAQSQTGARIVFQVTDSVVTATGYRKITVSVQSSSFTNFVAGEVFGLLFSADAAGGGAVTLDLGDDGANESAALAEIATTGDTNNIFGEPSADKLLIDVGKNWPVADLADEAEDLAAGASVMDYLDFPEESPDPSSPAADTMRVFARDDGNGNTEIVAVDSSGNESILSSREKAWTRSEVDISASATTDLATGLPSDVTEIHVVIAITGVSSDNGTNQTIQIGDSGGYKTSGYASALHYLGNYRFDSTTGILATNEIKSSADAAVIDILLTLVDESNNIWAANGQVGPYLGSFADTGSISGYVELSGALDRIRYNGVSNITTGVAMIRYR